MTTERGPERVEEARKEPWVVTISESVETALFVEKDGDRYFVARMTGGQHPLVTGYGDTREQAYHQLVDAMHALIGCLTDELDDVLAAHSQREPGTGGLAYELESFYVWLHDGDGAAIAEATGMVNAYLDTPQEREEDGDD